MVRPDRFKGKDFRRTIHVALDEVPAHAAANRDGTLEIYAGPLPEVAEIRTAQCFCENIERQGVSIRTRDRETASVHSDALPDDGTFGNSGRLQNEARSSLHVLQRFDAPCGFNDSGKHGEACTSTGRAAR
jgi:hypothetical protein